MTTYSSTQYSSTNGPHANGNDRIIPFDYTCTATSTEGDVINLCKIPIGYFPVGVHLQVSKAVGVAGTRTVKVGTNDGTTNDDDSLITATAVTGATAVAFAPPAATPVRAAADATVYATVAIGSSVGAADVRYWGFVAASPFCE